MKFKGFLIAGFSLVILCFLQSLDVDAQTGKVQANGITLAYETFGKASSPKVILINGTGAQMTDWPLAFCERLADKGYQVIRFDNRDVGLSTRLDSLGDPDWKAIIPLVKTCKVAPVPYTITDMARDVKGLMDALNIDKAHLVGASMGGAIAQLFTINFSSRVLSLTTISASSGDPDLPPAQKEAMQAMSTPAPVTKNTDSLASYLVNIYKALGSTDNVEVLRKKALQQITRAWYPIGSSRQAAAILIADNCDRRKELAKITVPTMVIHGDADPLVPLAAAKEIAATVPKSELHIINGMGHDFSLAFVDPLVSLVAKNLKR